MTDEQPNILVVLTDQQRWDTVGAYGSPMDLTPRLDEMAATGTIFERTFTPQPLCGPARAAIQTGQYAANHGVWKNAIPLPDAEHLLARRLDRAGYETGYVGKWHLSTTKTDPTPRERRGGYDYWRAADVLEFTSGPNEGYVYDERGERHEFQQYRVDAMTDHALSFLRKDRDDPFFLFLSYLEPHHQNDMETYVAPDGYAERYANPYVPRDLRGVPGDWHEELPDYYGICRRIDERIGDLLDEIENQGIADETLVVFTSDHGSHFRTRNEEYKRSCHESSIRVPLIVRGPEFDGGGGVADLVSLIDLPATLLDSAGEPIPEPMDGRSLRPLVAEADSEWRDEVFVQTSEASLGRGLRTDRWKYGVYDPSADPWEDGESDCYRERYLYDLRADPHERVNLVGHDDYDGVAADLRDRLHARIRRVEGIDAAIESADYQHF